MNYEEALTQYMGLRERRIELNTKLTRRLSKKTI